LVEGLLLIVLGGLGGLADNPEAETAMTDGYVVLAFGATVLTAVFVARRWPLVLAVATAATAGVGFLVKNADGSSLPPSFSPPRRSPSSRSDANCGRTIAMRCPHRRPAGASGVAVGASWSVARL
jgi:hypothetical protein